MSEASERARIVKERAKAAVSKAVAAGILVRPKRCEKCGYRGRIHGHHPNYRKVLSVRWLCVSCHGRVHAELNGTRPREGAPKKEASA